MIPSKAEYYETLATVYFRGDLNEKQFEVLIALRQAVDKNGCVCIGPYTINISDIYSHYLAK